MDTPRSDHVYFLISGPMASGKSTVARLLARRFECGVHLEGDVFRRSVVAGRHEMTPDAAPQALAQLRLRYRLIAMAGDAHFEEGFTVVDAILRGARSEHAGEPDTRHPHVRSAGAG